MANYCKECGTPSNFLIDGLCRKCYEYECKKASYSDGTIWGGENDY